MFAALAVVLGIIGWWAREASRWLLAAVLCFGLGGAAIGALAGADGYPWSNIGVLAVAVGGGVLLGRIVPPPRRTDGRAPGRPRPPRRRPAALRRGVGD